MSYNDGSTVFLLSVTGQIRGGWFPGSGEIYCKHCFVAGQDWAVTAGQEEGISQITRTSLDAATAVWNFPLDITFRSTGPFGWPQLVVSVYELDRAGNESAIGYGAVHVPLGPGAHKASLPMCAPQSASLMHKVQRFFGLGRNPEFVDPRVVSSGEGRDVIRVTSQGRVDVEFHVITKDLKRLGYESAPRGPVEEVKNRGPGEGMGLVRKRETEEATMGSGVEEVSTTA